MGKLKGFIASKGKRTKIAVAGGAAVVVAVAGYLLVSSYASGFFVSVDPENATVTGNASVVADASASGGKAVQFTGPASTGGGGGTGGGGTGGTATCTGSANTPGGSDGMGGCWPGSNNTGVPSGTALSAYTGSCTITTNNLTIDAKTINCPGDLLVRASNVIITRSKITGHVVVDTDVSQGYSLSMTDIEIHADGDLPVVYNGNVNILRANISGGHNALECQEHSSHCSLRDSWVHDQWQAPTGDTHLGGVAHFGEQVACTGTGTNGMTAVCFDIEHSSVVCDAPVNASGGGCTGDINMIAHYGPIPGAFIYKNLLSANVGASYCTYGGEAPENGATRIVYQDNIFQRGTNSKCGSYGPVTGFKFSHAGNLWTNNKYNDGSTITCTAADECL